MDWLGQNHPVATPTRRFRAKAWPGPRIKGNRAKATGLLHQSALSTTRGPNLLRERSSDKTLGDAASEPLATTRPATPSESLCTLRR